MSVLKDKLQSAMRGASPLVDFRQTVGQLLDEGMDRQLLMRELEELRAIVDSDSEDVILEVLDFIVGWSHPSMRL